MCVVDAIAGRHVASDPQQLLQRRRLVFSRAHGWQYDVWVDDAGKHALAGANSRWVGGCRVRAGVRVWGQVPGAVSRAWVTCPCRRLLV